MRSFTVLLCLLSACGSDDSANLVGEIAWSFNYRDWTKPNCAIDSSDGCTDDAIRTCDNQPATNPGPDYPRIATVQVQLSNPETPPFDESFDCARGRVTVKGIVRQSYRLEVTGKDAAGTVLYRYVDRAFDLTTFRSEDVQLRSVTGELNFFPAFPVTNQSCPSGIETLRWSAMEDGTTDVVASGSAPACDALDFVNELFLRGIPVEPEPLDNGAYLPVPHDVKLEALDGGGTVQYCSVSDRDVVPGMSRIRTNQNLVAGACP